MVPPEDPKGGDAVIAWLQENQPVISCFNLKGHTWGVPEDDTTAGSDSHGKKMLMTLEKEEREEKEEKEEMKSNAKRFHVLDESDTSCNTAVCPKTRRDCVLTGSMQVKDGNVMFMFTRLRDTSPAPNIIDQVSSIPASGPCNLRIEFNSN